MASLEHIQSLIAALGPDHDEIAAVAQNGDAQWAVAYDGDTIVTLDFVADQAKLVLSIDLGHPPPTSRLGVYETMLCYNMLWPETGGVKMGLGGANGELVQMFELNVTDLNGELLRTVLDGFAEKARMWRRFVADGPQGDTELGQAFSPDGPFLRV